MNIFRSKWHYYRCLRNRFEWGESNVRSPAELILPAPTSRDCLQRDVPHMGRALKQHFLSGSGRRSPSQNSPLLLQAWIRWKYQVLDWRMRDWCSLLTMKQINFTYPMTCHPLIPHVIHDINLVQPSSKGHGDLTPTSHRWTTTLSQSPQYLNAHLYTNRCWGQRQLSSQVPRMLFTSRRSEKSVSVWMCGGLGWWDRQLLCSEEMGFCGVR